MLSDPLAEHKIAWLKANDIDPRDVPVGAVPTVVSRDGVALIIIMVYLRDETGRKYWDGGTDGVAMKIREWPLKVAAPPELDGWVRR